MSEYYTRPSDFIQYDIDDSNTEPLCGCLSDFDSDFIGRLIANVEDPKNKIGKALHKELYERSQPEYDDPLNLIDKINYERLLKANVVNIKHLNALEKRLKNTPLCGNV